MRILLVEDDPTLGAAVRDDLRQKAHAVDWVQLIADANEAIASVDYGLVLLDLRLPDGSGIGFLKRLRTERNRVPLIILTAHDQISDRIEGLNAGADDYLVKPFNLDELSARIAAVQRRYGQNPSPGLTLGSLAIHVAERRVAVEGRPVDLSSREWAVLDCLASRPGAIVGKDRIEEALYAFGSEIESNTVEVYVSRLRKKLGRDAVVTVRGVGYRLREAS